MTRPNRNFWRRSATECGVVAGRWIAILAVVGAFFGLTINAALSAEFCVSCSQPFAMYRCAVNNDGVLSAPAGAQLPCIKELARQGGHKSCSVRRNSPAECIGKLLVLAPDPDMQIPPDSPLNGPARAQNDGAAVDGAAAGEVAAGEPGASEKREGEDGTGEEAPLGEPKTVVELADQTAKSSQKNLKKAGEAVVGAAKSTGGYIKNAGEYVGGAAKKTWDCIASLFFKCGS